MTREEIESGGFVFVGDRGRGFYEPGIISLYKKIVDNGHIISGHDTTTIYLEYSEHLNPNLEITLKRKSSFLDDSKVVFIGSCPTKEDLLCILKLVLPPNT